MAFGALAVSGAAKKLEAGDCLKLAMCGNRQPDKGRQRKNNVSKIPHAYYGCQKDNKCSMKFFSDIVVTLS